MPDTTPPLPDDLVEIATALERQRPQLSDLELDRLKSRALMDSRTIITNPKGNFMRSRLAVTTLLASGLLLSGGGTALGVSALQATDSAGEAQYGTAPATTGATTTPGTPTGPGTLGGTAAPSAGSGPSTDDTDTGGNAGVEQSGAPSAGTPAAGTPAGGVAGESASSPEDTAPTAPAAGEVSGDSAADSNPVQATRQVGAISGDTLPFTGYASIPVLLIGLSLFAAGLVMRRKSLTA